MNRLTPLSRAIRTRGRKQSKLIDLPSSGSSSKLGSFEMQARWITLSQPLRCRSSTVTSRISPLICSSFGLSFTASSTWVP